MRSDDVSKSWLQDQRERVNGLVDLLAGQNAAMHTVSIALEEQFIKPLEMTASGWKVQAAAQEAQEAKYSKTQSKKSAALTKHAHTCRQARDKALQGSANEAKSVKATSAHNLDHFCAQHCCVVLFGILVPTNVIEANIDLLV